MRQKYQIIHDPAANNLKIREYAIINRNLKNTETSMLHDSDYCLLYEEIYDGAKIASSMIRGTGALLSPHCVHLLFSLLRQMLPKLLNRNSHLSWFTKFYNCADNNY